MADPDAAVDRVHDALRPGGRFAVFGLRSVPAGPLRIVNPRLRPCLRFVANWSPDADVLDALETAFDDVDLVATYAAGIGFLTTASRKIGDTA